MTFNPFYLLSFTTFYTYRFYLFSLITTGKRFCFSFFFSKEKQEKNKTGVLGGKGRVNRGRGGEHFLIWGLVPVAMCSFGFLIFCLFSSCLVGTRVSASSTFLFGLQ